jgi:polyferredoxin
VCSEERKNYFFFAAFLAGFLATFFFAAFFLAAIVQLLSRRVFPWRFPGESLGFSAVSPRRKFLHGPEGRVERRCVSPSKTARARLPNRSSSQSSHVELAYTIV